MKHTLKITLFIVALFFAAQLTGLLIISHYIDIKKTAETGKTIIHEREYIIAPPRVENESYSFLYIAAALFVGTGVVLLIIRFRKRRLWKFWFFLSVFITLIIALFPLVQWLGKRLVPTQHSVAATVVIAFCLAVWKILKPNIIIHNLTEIFIYGGIAALLVPIVNLFSALMLLLVISLYDIYAVWKSKHMVRMAKFQTSSRVFAGLFVPYTKPGIKKETSSEEQQEANVVYQAKTGSTSSAEKKDAVLGGGDIAFPLIFSGSVMKFFGTLNSGFVTSVFAALSLLALLLFAKKDKFYPAMPFITLGCLAGYGAVLLGNFL